MLTLNFFDQFTRELKNFVNDAKDIFVDTINAIHHFLNRFVNDDFLLMLLIVAVAIIIIIIFKGIINHE